MKDNMANIIDRDIWSDDIQEIICKPLQEELLNDESIDELES